MSDTQIPQLTPDQQVIQFMVMNHALMSYLNQLIPGFGDILMKDLNFTYKVYWALMTELDNHSRLMSMKAEGSTNFKPELTIEWAENVAIEEKIKKLCSDKFGEEIINKAYSPHA